jgi:hypothetical protein
MVQTDEVRHIAGMVMRFKPDYPRLYSMAKELRESFASGVPFPNVVIDDFLDEAAYAVARQSYPPPGDPIWRRFDGGRVGSKNVSEGQGEPMLKEMYYSDAANDLLRELNSALFLRFLEDLTGIRGLTSDPYLVEGGFHMIDDGGFLDIHADFSHNGHTGLERRLNLLLYLNDDWKPEYGGALGLYDTDLREVRSVLPTGNRCVIFATSKTSYHGHPHEMKLPPNTYRRSIALYYYTAPTAERQRERIIFPAPQRAGRPA